MRIMHGIDRLGGQNVRGWFASEKLDGWRAVWTGKTLLTRTGNAYTAPQWFTAGLPSDTPLDCELWLGRGFNHTHVHSAVAANEWQRLKLVAFDVPELGLTIETAHRRLAALQLPAHAAVIQFSRVKSNAAAATMMQAIVGAGGEGIMLRKPRSPYVPWRDSHLLKLKP